MKKWIVFLFLLCPALLVRAAEPSQKDAEALFTKVYNLVFGEQGSSLNYSVNIIGLYKTQGHIYYKGKKVQYAESRYSAWEDGVTAYMVDGKKKTVNIYRYDDDRKDEYLSKFKYDVNNFTFSYKTEGDYYLITAKIKNASFFGIREVIARVHKNNLHPVSLTIKLAFIRTTVQITNFSSGNVPDSKFTFPRSQFKDYTFTDYRNDYSNKK